MRDSTLFSGIHLRGQSMLFYVAESRNKYLELVAEFTFCRTQNRTVDTTEYRANF